MGYVDPQTDTLKSFTPDIHTTTFSGGSVTYDTGPVVAQHIVEHGTVPNMQLHSHPGFKPFWSGTDVNAQNQQLKDAMSMVSEGVLYFIVMDGLEWTARKVTWKDREVEEIADGVATIHGTRLEMPKYTYTTFVSKKDKDKKEESKEELKGQMDSWKESDYDDDRYYNYWTGKSEKKPVEENYYGDWSSRNEDYDELFDAYKVKKYDWADLKATIEAGVPGDKSWYLFVVNNRGYWQYMGENEWSQEIL